MTDTLEALSLEDLEASETAQDGSAIELPAVQDFDPVKAAENFANETVVFECHIRKPGFVKTLNPKSFVPNEEAPAEAPAEGTLPIEDAPADAKAKTDPNLLHVQQDIIDRGEISEIGKCDERFLTWLKHPTRCVPYKMLANGLYLVLLSATEEIDTAFAAYLKERRTLINAFGEKYNALKEDARKRRGPHFREDDYPPFSHIRARYRVEARYLSFNVPAALERVSRDLYEREKQKVKMQWIDAAQDAVNAQRLAFQGITEAFADMLGVDDTTGKRKAFKPSAVKKMLDFLGMFDKINSLTSDAQLEHFVNQARELVKGVDPATLRKDATLRDALENGFKKIKDQASQLVVVQQREYAMDDD